MLRSLVWRLLGLLGLAVGATALAWLLSGGVGAALRGGHTALPRAARLARAGAAGASAAGQGGLLSTLSIVAAPALVGVLCAGLLASRGRARRSRSYKRLRVEPYQGDRASAEALALMFTSLQRRLVRRWWQRLLWGQASLALEVHFAPGGAVSGGGDPAQAWFAVSCPHGSEAVVEAALRSAYPNCSLVAAGERALPHGAIVRLRKARSYVLRAAALDRWVQERQPPVNGLLAVMAACGEPALVQFALTPAPALLERAAAAEFERREVEIARRRAALAPGRSLRGEWELRGALDVQGGALFFADIRVAASTRAGCERIASDLRSRAGENRLVERGALGRGRGRNRRLCARLQRGEGNPLPALQRGVFSAPELAALWQLPGTDFMAVPVRRATVPVAPAPPGVFRPRSGAGMLRDALGPVSIHPGLRRQNTAAPGAVDQGKTSFLVATIAEDLQRERCAVILLDPKGDAADAALSLVPGSRVCTVLDFASPTCGFNPLTVQAPADVIADYVVAALKHLFDAADIRASSDRYLRNAIIAVLAFDPRATLWDAARLLSVGEEGYAYRRAVAARVRALPEFKEVAGFFTSELAAQLADARSSAAHSGACALVAAALARRYPGIAVLGEPVLRREDARGAGWSCELGGRGGEARHRPDLVLAGAGTGVARSPVAVEVELSEKAPRRLDAICRAWSRSRAVEGVVYFVAPAAAGAVTRAVERARAQDRVLVLPLEGVIERGGDGSRGAVPPRT